MSVLWIQSYWNNDHFIIEIDDNKIYKHKFWHDAVDGLYILCRFKVTIEPKIWTDMSYQYIDMQAHIPEKLDDNSKIRLRIMYLIYLAYLANINFCYSAVQDHKGTNNSKDWYKNL